MKRINEENGYRLGCGWMFIAILSCFLVGFRGLGLIAIWAGINYYCKHNAGTLPSQNKVEEDGQLEMFPEPTLSDRVKVNASKFRSYINDMAADAAKSK